jgi:homocitrate synthase NifV
LRTDLILEDTTLRDGEQAPGVAFSVETKLAVHDQLVAAGVRWIEAGIPAMGGDEVRALQAMLARGTADRLVAWNRGVREDVELSLRLGFRAVHIGLPTSSIHLDHSVGRDREWLLRQVRELVGCAKDHGAFVSLSAEDVGRTDPSFLEEYAHLAHEVGADRLRLSDTIGILTPEGYADRVSRVTRTCPIDVQCHTHNDFGLAVANTLAGLRADARYFHVTVNGIGERAGMPDLAQTVMALKRLYGVDLAVDTSRLVALSNLVAEASGCAVPPWQPVVGRNVFAHESGIHVRGMLRDATTFEPMTPEEVGGERRLLLGKHSGRALLQSILHEAGLEPPPETLGPCLELVRALAVEQGGGVSPDQLLAIYRDVSGVEA